MNRKSLRVIASAVLLGVSVFGSVAVAAPANRASLDALVTRIKGDNELTRLYATHFNASVEKVADYINDLKPIALEKATLFNVFALRGGDSRIERYEIGSIVFADKNERPIMDAFGNPLVKPGDPIQDENQDDDDGAAVVGAAGAAAAVTGTGVAVAAIGTAGIIYAGTQARSDSNDPVPEPASLAVMGASMAMFAAARRKRNK